MSVTFTIEGLDRWYGVVDADRLKREVDAAVQRAAQVVRDDTKKLPPVNKERTGFQAKGIPVAPKYGGTLRQSLAARRIGLMAAEVYVGPAAAAYGGYVHDGTSKMPARPFFRWLLDDFGGAQKIDTLVAEAVRRFVST